MRTKHAAGRRSTPAPSNAALVQIGESEDSLKTYCKHTRCGGTLFVRHCIDLYLKDKKGRSDVKRFIASYDGDLDAIAADMAGEIRSGNIRLGEIRYFNRVEPTNGKRRIIGRETVRHQIFDWIAVTALMPMLKAKVGPHQCASIKGRGTGRVRQLVKRWSFEGRFKYFIKMDVRKYYPSIDRPTLKAMLSHDVGDAQLLRLTFTLIDSYQGGNGLNIGSYLSQWLANYYLSGAFHHAAERLTATRRRKDGTAVSRRLIDHVVFYMDDILLVSHSKRDLKMAARRLVKWIETNLKVSIHPEWNLKYCALEPVDMAGFTFRPDGRVNIRTVIFLRMRRAFNRAARASWIGYALAKRCASYWGYLVHSDSWSYRRRHGIDSTMRRVRASLRLHAKMQRRRYAITDRVQ